MKNNSNQKQHKILEENLDEERIDDVLNIMSALFFLREEAERKNHKIIYALITSVFNICIIVYDQVCNREDIKIQKNNKITIEDIARKRTQNGTRD